LPGLPYALAGCFKLFGAHAIAAADAMILLCGLATLACTYRMVYLAFGRPTAVGIAFGFACLHEFHRYCYEIMTETPFLAGVTAFLAGYQAIFGRTKADPNHRACWWDWVLLLGGMAVGLLVRPNMIPMLGILMVLLLWQWIGRDKRLVWAAIGLAIMAAAVAVILLMHHQSNGRFSNIYMETLRLQWQHPGVWLRNKVWPNVMDVFGASAAQSTFAFKFGNDWLNLMFGGLALASALALFRYEPLWGWWVAATIATMILVQSHDRYLLAIGPLLSLGWWRMIRRVHLSLPKHAANVIFLILLGLGTGVNGTRVGQLVGRQHRHPFYRIYKQGKYASVIEVAESIGKQATSQDVIVTPNMDERIYSFLCDHPAYSRDEFNTMKLAYRRALVIVDPPGDDGKWLFAPGTIFLPYPEPLTPALRPGRRSPIWVYSAQRPL